MTNLLLQKIEELTLYTIEQEKRINKQEKQVNEQQEYTNKQEKRIKALEEKLTSQK